MTSYNRNPDPMVFNGDPVPGLPVVGEGRRQFSPVSYRVTYVNDLPTDVTVVWRSGFSFTIPPLHNGRVNKFIARLEITIHPSVKVDVHRLLDALEATSSPELLAMKQAVDIGYAENPYGGLTITLDYPITLDALQQRGGAVYYSELDEVVSILKPAETPFHPYSDCGQIHRTANGGVQSSQRGFVYNLEVVDNYSRFGTRYLNIGGEVYRIDPSKDSTRRDGIYLSTNGSCDGELGGTMPVAKRISFEKAVKALCLYRSFDEASCYGDEETVRKRIDQEADRRTLDLKRQLQDQKHQQDMEKLEQERQERVEAQEQDRHQQELKRVRERVDLELETRRLQMKEQYEFRSYDRKDNSESVKHLPAMIVGLGAAFMTLKQFMPG